MPHGNREARPCCRCGQLSTADRTAPFHVGSRHGGVAMATSPQSSLSNSSTMYNCSVCRKNADHISCFSMHSTSLGKNAEPTRSTHCTFHGQPNPFPVLGEVMDGLPLTCPAGEPRPGGRPRRGTWGLPHPQVLPETEGRWTVVWRPSLGQPSPALIHQNEISAQIHAWGGVSSSWVNPRAFLWDFSRALALRGRHTHTRVLATPSLNRGGDR